MLEIEAKKKFKIAQKNFENKNYKEAQRLWSEIVVYYPKNLSVLRNLSLAYFYDKNLYQSEIYLKKIIEINKKEPNALTMLILVLEDQDKINEAIEYIDLGLKEELLGNDWQIKKELMLPVIFKDLKDIKNSRIKLDKSIDNILKSKIKISLDINSQLIKPVQFALSYDQYDNLKINKKCVELYRKIYPQLNSKYLLKKISSSKIRIGFVSEYLTDHTIGKLFKGIILKLDKK